MKKHQIDWSAIDEAASRLGVSEHARLKWRDKKRGVPFKWWYRISKETAGKVTFKQLESSRDNSKQGA